MEEKRRDVPGDAHDVSPGPARRSDPVSSPRAQGPGAVQEGMGSPREPAGKPGAWYADFDLAWINFDTRGTGGAKAAEDSSGGVLAFSDLEVSAEAMAPDRENGETRLSPRAFIDLDFPGPEADADLERALAQHFERPCLEAFPPSYAMDDLFAGAVVVGIGECTEDTAAVNREAAPLTAEDLSRAIGDFSVALEALREALHPYPELSARVFEGTEEWIRLLEFKLLPHQTASGCLVVSVAGGTNTGKSTVFNRLLRDDVSPVRITAAATRRPVLAGNAARCAQCLAQELLAEFQPRLLANGEELISDATPVETLFVHPADALPDHVALLDIPDVDSIDTANWEVAENIQAAGDVLIAVLTGEKYKDERVVTFFRRAHAAGRMIVPLMNKANPHNHYEVARIQLEDFCNDVELDHPPCFVLPYDPAGAGDFSAAIPALDGDGTLPEYLEALDAAAIKEQVYRVTVNRFASQAATFLERTEALVDGLRPVIAEFENRARLYAQRYDPAPGAEVGGLFHEFVQSKRNRFDRAIGNASRTLAQGISVVGRTVSGALFRRAALEGARVSADEKEVREVHVRAIERFTRELATSYYESARGLEKSSGHLILGDLEALDLDEVVADVLRQTLQAKSISEDFRAHAERLLEGWWTDHAGRRRVIEALDRLLLFAPAGIAGIMAVHTAGVGLPEAMVVAGPIFEQFAARVLEYQFGDAMFDFVSPWCEEQRAAFENALIERLTRPSLRALCVVVEPLGGELTDQLRRCQRQCLTAS